MRPNQYADSCALFVYICRLFLVAKGQEVKITEVKYQAPVEVCPGALAHGLDHILVSATAKYGQVMPRVQPAWGDGSITLTTKAKRVAFIDGVLKSCDGKLHSSAPSTPPNNFTCARTRPDEFTFSFDAVADAKYSNTKLTMIWQQKNGSSVVAKSKNPLFKIEHPTAATSVYLLVNKKLLTAKNCSVAVKYGKEISLKVCDQDTERPAQVNVTANTRLTQVKSHPCMGFSIPPMEDRSEIAFNITYQRRQCNKDVVKFRCSITEFVEKAKSLGSARKRYERKMRAYKTWAVVLSAILAVAVLVAGFVAAVLLNRKSKRAIKAERAALNNPDAAAGENANDPEAKPQQLSGRPATLSEADGGF